MIYFGIGFQGILFILKNEVSEACSASFPNFVYKYLSLIFLDSSMVEHSAVNRVVVGSSPTRGARMFNDFVL